VRRPVVITLALTLVGTASSTAAQPEESLSCFHGCVTLSLPNGAVAAAPVLSEDLPTPGYRNRWRYVVGPRVAQVLRGTVFINGPLYAQVRVAATPGGSMVHEALGLFRLELAPAEPKLAAALRTHAPGEETIWQTMTLTPLPEGYAELITEEPSTPR
jgi:hypothetical protein